jgi:N-methylhydantoinase A
MRVGVDIGGTFTDVVAFDERGGSLIFAKSPTTPRDLASGVRRALASSEVPLEDVQTLIHGSTVAINALVERRGARTALLTTQGFRDVYEIGRINRPESFNPRFRKHRPLVPREDIFEIPERILANGSIRTPLDEAAVRHVADVLADEDFESVAIVFLHAYRHPDHELRAAKILRERNSKWFITASHELSREYREYERTSTTAANAYVGPIVSAYLADLDKQLRDDRLAGELLIMQSNGGVADVDLARAQCVHMLESGPAGGLVAAARLCEALELERAIAFDMGGTTAKAGVVQRGAPTVASDYFIGGYNEGLAIRIPVLDVVEVGTGGGSVAWLDESGALHVGPRSAGAEPGPAAYGRGGMEPTVTDANVVLGRLSPDVLLPGETRLNRAAAEDALRSGVAEPLGTDLTRAADGILEVATASMANAIRQVTLERGLDPRDFALFAYGGGGPLHARAVARELQIAKVIVPRAPGVFSALGMLLADVRRDYVQTLFVRLAEVDLAHLEREFAALEAEGLRALQRSGVSSDRVVFERAADMRYVGQEHAVTVRLPSGADIKPLFDAAHEQRYSHSAPAEPAEIVSLRLTAIGRLTKPTLPRLARGERTPTADARMGTREVVFGGRRIETAVFARDCLLTGNVVDGPAVIEESGATTLVEPGDRVSVNGFGHLVMELV